MKNIKVMATVYNLSELYKVSSKSKARRGLFGYMLHTARPDNQVCGGAMRLVEDLESVGSNLYKLNLVDKYGKEIVAVAEVALAGGFNKFALSKKEINKTLKSIVKLGLDY